MAINEIKEKLREELATWLEMPEVMREEMLFHLYRDGCVYLSPDGRIDSYKRDNGVLLYEIDNLNIAFQIFTDEEMNEVRWPEEDPFDVYDAENDYYEIVGGVLKEQWEQLIKKWRDRIESL